MAAALPKPIWAPQHATAQLCLAPARWRPAGDPTGRWAPPSWHLGGGSLGKANLGLLGAHVVGVHAVEASEEGRAQNGVARQAAPDHDAHAVTRVVITALAGRLHRCTPHQHACTQSEPNCPCFGTQSAGQGHLDLLRVKTDGPAASCHVMGRRLTVEAMSCSQDTLLQLCLPVSCSRGVDLRVHYRAGPLLRLQVKCSPANVECNRWQVGHIGASTHYPEVTRVPVIHHSRDCLHWHCSHQSAAHHNKREPPMVLCNLLQALDTSSSAFCPSAGHVCIGGKRALQMVGKLLSEKQMGRCCMQACHKVPQQR